MFCTSASLSFRILNKLTPETFPLLSHKLIHEVGITSLQTLRGAVILVSVCVCECVCVCVCVGMGVGVFVCGRLCVV